MTLLVFVLVLGCDNMGEYTASATGVLPNGCSKDRDDDDEDGDGLGNDDGDDDGDVSAGRYTNIPTVDPVVE